MSLEHNQFDRTEFSDYYEYAAALSCRTLGRTAVLFENERVGNELRCDYWQGVTPNDDVSRDIYINPMIGRLDRGAQQAAASRDDALDSTAGLLLNLEPEERRELSLHFDDIVPQFFQDNYKAWRESMKPTIWKSARNAFKSRHASERSDLENIDWVSWIVSGASEAQRLNFLQWHVHRISTLASSDMCRPLIDQERQVFSDGVRWGIDQAQLPKSALSAAEEAKDAPIVFADILSGIHVGGLSVAGYVSSESTFSPREIFGWLRAAFVVEPSGPMNNLEDRIQHATVHELNHLLLGRLGPEWVNEALTEHIAQAMRHGQWLEVSPFKRNDDGSYPWYRELLAVVLEPYNEDHDGDADWLTGGRFVPLGMLTYAYAERDPQARREHKQGMHDSFRLLYGRSDILEVVDARLDEILSTLPGYDPDKRMIELEQVAAKILVDEWKDPDARSALLTRIPDLSPAGLVAIS